MRGKVVLIGAGPGDPQLLTLRGKHCLEQADCIVYDRLASKELLGYAKQDCECVYVGKENHHHTMRQEEINALLYEKTGHCALVVRLKGGDPYVFGRGAEEALFLKEKGVAVEVVSGISSVIAALADAGIPITHRGLSKGFQVVTAHSRKDVPADIDYAKMQDDTITYLFLMGLSHVKEIATGLMAAGKSADTPVAVISNGTTAGQKKVVGSLQNIDRMVSQANLVSPAIIVVGAVVSLSDQLDFFEKRPLFGKKYVVPYITSCKFRFGLGQEAFSDEEGCNSELVRKLEEQGAQVCAVKVGRIVPVKIPKEDLLESLRSDWLLFTSQNGVYSFLWNLKEYGLDIRSVSGCRIAVVGQKTAQALEQVAIKADLMPDQHTARSLCACMTERNLFQGRKDLHITLFGAKQTNEDMITFLKAQCQFRKMVCYQNAIVENVQNGYDNIDFKRFDGILFTSGSSVTRFLKLSKGMLPECIYAIGPTCSAVVKKETGCSCMEAKNAGYQELCELVVEDAVNKTNEMKGQL